MEIQSILEKNEFADLINFLNKNKIDHFLTAGNVREVYGKWNVRRRDGTSEPKQMG